MAAEFTHAALCSSADRGLLHAQKTVPMSPVAVKNTTWFGIYTLLCYGCQATDDSPPSCSWPLGQASIGTTGNMCCAAEHAHPQSFV